MKSTLLLLVPLLAALSSGCTTIYGYGGNREEAAREDMMLETLQQQVQRLEARLEGVEASQEDVHRRISDVERDAADTEKRVESRVAAAEQAIAAVDAARVKDRDETINKLSKKMAELVASSTPPPQRLTGREHVVKTGQTLSEIAAAYGVSANAIIRANNISRPDLLKVGQTLFIPE